MLIKTSLSVRNNSRIELIFIEYNIRKLYQFVTTFQFWIILVENNRNMNIYQIHFIMYQNWSQPAINHLLISFTLFFSIIRIWWFQGKILTPIQRFASFISICDEAFLLTDWNLHFQTTLTDVQGPCQAIGALYLSLLSWLAWGTEARLWVTSPPKQILTCSVGGHRPCKSHADYVYGESKQQQQQAVFQYLSSIWIYCR